MEEVDLGSYNHAVPCRTRRLPVLFIFGKEVVDVRDCERCLRNTIATGGEEHVLVMLDTVYSHCTGVN